MPLFVLNDIAAVDNVFFFVTVLNLYISKFGKVMNFAERYHDIQITISYVIFTRENIIYYNYKR